jgi:hypothetical protein
MRSRLLPLLLVVTLAACAGNKRPERERLHTNERVQPGAFPDVAAVILLERSELTFTYSTKARRPYAQQLVTRRIQLLREDALDLAKVMIPYDNRSRILHIQARVMKPGGKVIESPADRFVELPRFKEGTAAAALYGGEGYKLTKVSGAEVGDVIELSYLRVFRDPRWVEPVRVGGELPVVRGEVIVNAPRSFDVDYRVTKLGRAASKSPTKLPQSIKGEGDAGEGVPGDRLIFVFENEPAIYPEERRPDVEALATQVHVQLQGYVLRNERLVGYKSWDDVATWYRELTEGADLPSPAIERAAKPLGGKSGTKAEKLRRVQRYVQDRVGDVPAFLNLAALPKHMPEDLINGGVGDAKDKASLGLALLRHMGIDGFPVLVTRLGSYAVVPDLPTPAPFNHVVLAVPAGGAYHFIDPSTPLLPVGRLPGALQGQRGLLVRPDRAELIDLPEDKPGDNTRTFELDLALSREGIAQGQMRVELTGLDAARARTLLRDDPVSAPAKLKALLFGEGSAFPWQSVTAVSGPRDDADKPLKLQVVLGAGEVGSKKGDRLALHLERILGRPLPALWREARRMPLVFEHAYTEKVRLSVSLPDGLGIEALPLAVASRTHMLAIDERWAIADGTLWLNRKLELSARAVDAEDYLTLRDPVQALWGAQAAPVGVVPGGERGESYGGDPF